MRFATVILFSALLLLPCKSSASQTLTRIYRDIQQQLLVGPLNERQIALLPKIFSDRKEIELIIETNEHLITLHNTPHEPFDAVAIAFRLENSWQKAIDRQRMATYAHFIKARPAFNLAYSYLENVTLRILNYEAESGRRTGNGRFYAWYWGYIGRAILNFYHASKDTRFIELFIKTEMEILRKKDDKTLNGTGTTAAVHSWSTSDQSSGQEYFEITVAGLVALPATQFLVEFSNDPFVREKYQHEIDVIRQDTEETIKDFAELRHYTAQGSSAYFVHPVSGEVEALNHTHVYGAAAAQMHEFTHDPVYQEIVESLCRYFDTYIVLNDNDSYSWPYAPSPLGEFDKDGEPFFKAIVTVLLPLEAYRAGLCYTEVDMQRFSNTFVKNILSESRISLSIDPPQWWSRNIYNTAIPRENLIESLAAIYMLAPFDQSIPDQIEKLLINRTDLFEDGWLSGSRAAIYAWSLWARDTYKDSPDSPARKQSKTGKT